MFLSQDIWPKSGLAESRMLFIVPSKCCIRVDCLSGLWPTLLFLFLKLFTFAVIAIYIL